MSKFKAGIIGLAVGVTAGAVALALSDKHNRKKVRRALEDMKDATVDILDELDKKTKPLRKEAESKIVEIQKKRNETL